MRPIYFYPVNSGREYPNHSWEGGMVTQILKSLQRVDRPVGLVTYSKWLPTTHTRGSSKTPHHFLCITDTILQTLFWTFNELKNVKSRSSIRTILILIFDKHTRRGADDRCQVLVIGAKI